MTSVSLPFSTDELNMLNMLQFRHRRKIPEENKLLCMMKYISHLLWKELEHIVHTFQENILTASQNVLCAHCHNPNYARKKKNLDASQETWRERMISKQSWRMMAVVFQFPISPNQKLCSEYLIMWIWTQNARERKLQV